MRKTVKNIFATGFAVMMMTGTAFAGTWETTSYSPIQKLTDGVFNDGNEYQNYQTSIKIYSGFVDDRSQAFLVDMGWKYKKDNGTYAASEWIQDEAAEYYVRQNGFAVQGFAEIKGNSYFFEPTNGHLMTDAIIEMDSIKGEDIQYTVNEDGTWDFISSDGSNIKNYQYHQYYYCDEDGVLVAYDSNPDGAIVDRRLPNVVKKVYEDGVPVLTIGSARYVAQKSSSDDTTYEQNINGRIVKNAEHVFYTVYKRQK